MDVGGRSSRRAVLMGGAAATLAGTAGPVLWARPSRAEGAAVPIAGAHLAHGADPTSQAALVWSTAMSVTGAVLDLGLTSELGTTITPDDRGSKDVATIYHRVGLDGLSPGTTYHYRLRHDGAEPVIGTFTTASPASIRFRAALLGDMGVTRSAASVVRQIRRQRPDVVLAAGDLSYADSQGRGTGGPANQDFAKWDRWMQQVAPSAAGTAWMTSVGNHEMEGQNGDFGYDGYLDRLAMPANGAAGGPVTYSFVRGNVAFVVLDSNDAAYETRTNTGYLGTTQDTWLVETLDSARRRDDVDFVVVALHHCAFCTNAAHGSDGGVRDRWGAILDRFQVDLVVSGHNHCYERTHLMRAGLPVQEAPAGAVVDSATGTTYLTVGGGGQTLSSAPGQPYVISADGTRSPESGAYRAAGSPTHSIAVLDALPRSTSGVARLRMRVVGIDGVVIDSLTLQRRHTPWAG